MRGGPEIRQFEAAPGAAVDALRASEGYFRSIVEGLGDAVLVLEPGSTARVLLVSGYAALDPVDDLAAYEFLQKPFTPAALASRVREPLDR